MDFRVEQVNDRTIALVGTEGDWERRQSIFLDEGAPVEQALRNAAAELRNKFAAVTRTAAVDYNARLAAILAG